MCSAAHLAHTQLLSNVAATPKSGFWDESGGWVEVEAGKSEAEWNQFSGFEQQMAPG